MPQINDKPKFKRGFKKESDELAVAFRRDLNISQNAPLCAFKLCEHLGIKIFTPIDFPELSKAELKALLVDGSKNWSAATIPIESKKPIILRNPNHSEARQQSNLMHELAHILLEHKVSKEKVTLGLSGFLRNHNDLQELEANWLGACLQLPRPALLWALKKGMSVSEMSKYFVASEKMVKYRIGITGVKKQFSYYK